MAHRADTPAIEHTKMLGKVGLLSSQPANFWNLAEVPRRNLNQHIFHLIGLAGDVIGEPQPNGSEKNRA
ncbi:hypothetical protein Mapa_013651 [Marchantia paleacea]|nr:hypothetical protein Mapa_013651 [Marchantia paleacea]